jgi:hypothetical protein
MDHVALDRPGADDSHLDDQVVEGAGLYGRAHHRDFAGAGGGRAGRDLCRKHNLSSPTFYKWKDKHGGLDVSEARLLKAEKTKLRQLPYRG